MISLKLMCTCNPKDYISVIPDGDGQVHLQIFESGGSGGVTELILSAGDSLKLGKHLIKTSQPAITES